MKKIIRITTYLVLLFIPFLSIQAKKIPALIITQKEDTIFGKIKPVEVSLLSFNGVGYEGYYEAVPFMANGEKKFKSLLPDSIKALHFSTNQGLIIYTSFTLEYRNMATSEIIKKRRLLQLRYSNTLISLYQNQFLVNNSNFQKSSESLSGHKVTDFYLYNIRQGLTKVEQNETINSIKDLLHLYKFNDEFINSLGDDITFKDIQSVLNLYDSWFKSR